MPLSRADAEGLRDAIQDLLFYARHRPTSLAERQQASAAWQTLDRLTASPIGVPGEDGATWTFRLRKDGWTVYKCAGAGRGNMDFPPADVEALKRIKECQDVLRVLSHEEDNPPRRRGRKRHCNWQKDSEIAKAWERARDAGIVKKAFARDKGLSTKELNRILNRHAKRARTKPVK